MNKNPSNILSLKDISFSLGEQNILQKVSFELSEQEILTIIGPNGAGKSTLVKIIAGLVKPTSGSIQKSSTLKIGYVPQKLKLDQSLPMKVSRFLSLANISRIKRSEIAILMGIEKLMSKQIHQLSGGELQRVLLARALSIEPQLLLLDEPLQGIDVNGQVELYRLIGQVRNDFSCAVLMVSHDLHLVMAQSDSVICLNQHICCHGVPESVSQHPEYLKLFGKQAAHEIAVYTHHHDHHHTIDGEIEPCNTGCNHD